MSDREQVMASPEPQPVPMSMSAAQKLKAWDVEIDVYLELDRDPPFRLETCLPVNSAGEILFENHGRPGFIINFNLQDPDGTGYRFPDDEDEALYAAKGNVCPTSKSSWGQFKPLDVKNDNRTLVVRNLNQKGEEGKFGYALRVTKDDGKTFLLLDPIGDNRNGHS